MKFCCHYGEQHNVLYNTVVLFLLCISADIDTTLSVAIFKCFVSSCVVRLYQVFS